jgi:outer membrane protein assembly factor BamB
MKEENKDKKRFLNCLVSSIVLLFCSLLSAQAGNSHRRWIFEMEGTVVQSPAIGSDGTIYIGTGMFYESSAADALYAIRPDGTRKWKRNVGRPVHSSIALHGKDNLCFLAGNAANDDRMDAVVVSYDSSGSLRWTSEAIGWLYPIPFTGFTPAIAADGNIYACGRFSLFAMDPGGKTKWKYDFPLIDNTTSSGVEQPAGNQRSAPTIANDGTIYVNTVKGSYGQTEVEGGLFAFDPDGNLKWRTYDVGGYAAPIIGKDGTIYSAIGCYWVPGDTSAAQVATESKLLAIHPDGTPKWSVPTQLWIQSSPSIGADGTLYVGTTHHPLDKPAWFYAITPEGKIKWKYDTYDDVKDMPPAKINPPDIYNSPAIDSNGRIYFGNEIGLLYAVSPDGKVEWIEDVWSLHDQGPALASDGTLYVATHSPFGLIALNTGSRGLADSHWPKFRRNNANTGNAGAPLPPNSIRNSEASVAFELVGNYPNPFNPSTRIPFTLGAPGIVRLEVFDMTGRTIATLLQGPMTGGPHVADWSGTSDSGEIAASGHYGFRLTVSAAGRTVCATRKMTLVR